MAFSAFFFRNFGNCHGVCLKCYHHWCRGNSEKLLPSHDITTSIHANAAASSASHIRFHNCTRTDTCSIFANFSCAAFVAALMRRCTRACVSKANSLCTNFCTDTVVMCVCVFVYICLHLQRGGTLNVHCSPMRITSPASNKIAGAQIDERVCALTLKYKSRLLAIPRIRC